MDETDENMSADDSSMVDSPSSVKVKPKKRSLVERELETSLTARVTSPVTNSDTCSTSRYGRARRLKPKAEFSDAEKIVKQLKSPVQEKTPVKMQSPVYKMHASNSPIKTEPKETPTKDIATDSSLENQIENIYHENISLSRFGSDEKKNKSPRAKFPKVYVRKDLIQKREKEDTVVLIKNMFSPIKSPYKTTNSHLNNILERSSEKYHLNTASKPHNGYLNTSSVVKTLDFDSNKKKKKENRDGRIVLSKSDLFDMEAKCEYQVGDLAWARMGTYPFWPCIVTREPSSGMFVKKKLFGRIERDVIHVTFFGDNGRRSWIVDTMLRKFLGQLEFEATRERFSPMAKKRDPRLYAAFFISEKKMSQWSISVEEAETLLREPKRLRIDILHDMLAKSRLVKSATKAHKSGKITRTASDVSLSESLYDTLFSEDDGKAEAPDKSKSKTRKSLDVSEVVTACLDNMAAKTGITKIQRQSHMDRWLQKAKSKTPEKLQAKVTPQTMEKEVKVISSKKKKKVSPTVPKQKPYSFRKSVYESQNLKSYDNEHDYSSKIKDKSKNESEVDAGFGIAIDVTAKIEPLSEKESADEDKDEDIQLSKSLIDTTDDTINISLNSEFKMQENCEIAPIMSADDSVDEVQVNICSVEENAELERCLNSEQTIEHAKVDKRKSTRSLKSKSHTDIKSMDVDSETQVETMEVDADVKKNFADRSKRLFFPEIPVNDTNVVKAKTKSKKYSKNKTENVEVVLVVQEPKKSSDLTSEFLDNCTNSHKDVENMDLDSSNVLQEIPSDIFDINISSENISVESKKLEDSKNYCNKSIEVEQDLGKEKKPEGVDSNISISSIEIDVHKPDNSLQVVSGDSKLKQNYFDKPVLRKRNKRHAESKKPDQIDLVDNLTAKNFERPILTRKRSSKKHSAKKMSADDEVVKEIQIDCNRAENSIKHMEDNNKEIIPTGFENQIENSEIEFQKQECLQVVPGDKSSENVISDDKSLENVISDDKSLENVISDDKSLENVISDDKSSENVISDDKIVEDIQLCSDEIHLEEPLVNSIAIIQPHPDPVESLDRQREHTNDSPETEDNIESNSKDNDVIQNKQIEKEKETPKPVLGETIQSVPEDDIEYGHLAFTEKAIIQEPNEKLPIDSNQITETENTLVNIVQTNLEDREYDHLDFIFSSFGEKQTEKHSDANIIAFESQNRATNPYISKEMVVENIEGLNKFQSTDKIEASSKFEQTIQSFPCIIEENLGNEIKLTNFQQRELRVSVEKLPLSSLPSFAQAYSCTEIVDKDNILHREIKIDSVGNIQDDKEKKINDEKNTDKVVKEIMTNGDSVSDMSVDEDLDERLILQEDSFEKTPSADNGEDSRTNDANGDNNFDVNNHMAEAIKDDSMSNESLVRKENNGDGVLEKTNDENLNKYVEYTDVTLQCTDRIKDGESIEIITSVNENSTINSINNENGHKTISKDLTTYVEQTDNKDNSTDKSNTGIDVDMFVTSVNRLPEPVKLNGFHVDECIDFSDGEFNAETSSINSEDSEPLSITKTKLLMRNRSQAKKALDDAEFVKYLELRQDEIMDQHPELSQEDIIEYLYKTWQYEENAKPELVKNDDIEQFSLVKGLNENLRPKKSRHNFRDCKKRSKKRDEDSISINSDISDNSVKRRLRTRMAKSPVISIEDSDASMNKEMSLEIKTELLDTISINSDISCNSLKYMPYDDKPSETPISEPKDDIPVNSNHVDIKNASPDKTTDESEDIKQTKTKEKSKSPKTKDTSIKNYFKSINAVSEQNNHIDDPITIETKKIKEEYDPDTISINSEDSEVSQSKRRRRYDKNNKSMTDPEFLKYVELRQDPLIDENPQLTQDEIISYLFKTWIYEENSKSDIKKTDDLEQASLVKGLNQGPATPQHKKVKRKVKVEKDYSIDEEVLPKDKPRRKVSQPYYNEEMSDIEDEIELFEIFKPKKKLNLLTTTADGKEIKTEDKINMEQDEVIEIDEEDEVELYFSQLTQPKPNVFKGLVREKVCEICEKTGNLVKCKGCNCMFHAECVKKEKEIVEVAPEAPTRGRKKKKKNVGRKPKSLEDSESHSDEKSQDVSEELNLSMEDELESRTVNLDDFETVLAAKMQEILPTVDANYDSYSSDDGLDWNSAPPGKCEIVDVKLKPKLVTDYSNFKCNKCEKYNTPVCFVCKEAVSKTGVEHRQRCQTAHCYKYYHLECLDHWPQTQFHSGEPSKRDKKINEHFEAVMCPRHVCHTCVSDDPRGCKTRFSGDKLARCVRCPATYHSFTKCLPAGSQILTGSLIVCPRHYEHRPGKVPCHVNTGWCFICALGGSLICCEYCPTSFHAECLNIKPPEGGYMCEDCETGRLPLYGEMVWVKLGHYRWWPGIILHPCEIPENIMAVKHSPGEFVVRFFGQYDHYWVNRGRVFPFQEGDSGKISSQKSKIDAAFTTAMEHAQRACEILKTAVPNEEESLDIASSLLPPHYVKLKVNKPCGSLCGRRVETEESSLTQCECAPGDREPCGPYSHCLNRMLLTECGPACRAGERCLNRAFERRQYPRLAPYRTPQRGWGLKALEDIRAGQFVIEYVGELIDEEEFRRRMNRKHEIRDENFYFLTLDKERMIDAGPKGNLARFMNHCCEPNCETQKWTVLGDVRVGLFALYDIPANSELTFNYNLECAGIEKKRCMCGAKRCSGYIGAKPKQEESQPKKNKLSVKRTYKKRKNVEESPSTSKNKPKRPVGRPAKPRELTEIEKDLLIIKNATNGLSSDSEGSGRLSSVDSERYPKALKRKRVSFSTEECSKKAKVDGSMEVGD